MKIKYFKFILLFLLLSVICFASSHNFIKADDEALINYSKNSATSTNYSYSEIINILCNEIISNGEEEYLKEQYPSLNALKLETKIPTSSVTTSLSVVGGVTNLSVHASAYSYTDISNNIHIWIPVEANINSQTLKLNYNNFTYDCIFINVNDDESLINVKYECKFILAKEDCNNLINKAYNDAKQFIDDGVEEIENSKYQEKLANYNEYLQKLNKYNEDLELYRQYIINKNKYEEDLNAYQEYLDELEEYNQNEIDYNDYLEKLNQYEIDLDRYRSYLNELENYNNLKAEYDQKYPTYYEKISLVRHQLEVVDCIKQEMTSMNRSIYNAVMGSTVTSVLERKEELKILNADEDAIERAGQATVILRDLFTQYFSLEDENSKYGFYAYRSGFNFVNYQALKYNIEELCRCLEKLYRSGLVAKAIDVMEKKPQYLILIAQLVLISEGLDDNPLYNFEGWNYSSKKPKTNATSDQIIDMNYVIDGRTLKQILENNNYIEDTTITAYPLLEGYPVLVEPTLPTAVNNPIRPTAVVRMSEPDTVDYPGEAPTEVFMPDALDVVEEPIPYSIPDRLKEVIDEFKSFNLKKRKELEEDFELCLESNLNKNFRNQTEVTVDFYNAEGNFLCSETTDYASYIVYNLELPYKAPDEKYSSYKFLYFEYTDSHKILDLNNVTEGGWVQPVFEGTIRKFNISWLVNGKEYIEEYSYGDTPSFKGTISKQADINCYYTFSGWDKELTSVTKDEIYTAMFKENYIYQDIENILMNNDNVSIKLGSNDDLFNDGLDIKQLLQIHPNIKSIILSCEEKNNTKINIDYNNLEKIKNDGITSIKFEIIDNQNGDYKYNILLFKDEEIINNGAMFAVTIEGDYDEIHSSLYYEYDGISYKVQGNIKNKKLSFNMNANYVYHIYPTYEVKILKTDYASVSCDKYQADAFDTITVFVEGVKKGINILGIFVVDEESNEILLTNEDGITSFEMPRSNCYIGIDYSFIYYNVKFMVDENIYSEMNYRIGEEVLVPTNPKKISNENHSYEFEGWSPEVMLTVDGDATYYAKFKEIDTTLKPVEAKNKFIMPLIIITLCVLLFGVGAFVVIVILKRKKIIFNKNKLRK